MTKEILIPLIIGLLGGGGLWNFIIHYFDYKKTLNSVPNEIKKLREEIQEQNAVAARVRILRFSDELIKGVEHSKESFDQTLSDLDMYEDYCATHPLFKNNKTVLASERIKTVYQKLLAKGGFL